MPRPRFGFGRKAATQTEHVKTGWSNSQRNTQKLWLEKGHDDDDDDDDDE
jgi:hypothetical protein